MKKKEEQLQISLDRVKLQKHVYELCRVQKLTINEVRKKTGLGMGTIYRYLHTFEEENPKLVEQMKKQGPNIIPEDYKKLQEEVLRLKCELKREKLRADFYEEMVAFGKDAKRQLVRAKPEATMHAAMNNIDFILFLKFKITDKNEGESKL
jgi:transposase